MNVTCSHHDIAEKIAHLVLNNNHSFMTFENKNKRINPIVDNVTNSNNKNTPQVNFNPFNTQLKGLLQIQ